MNKDIIKSFIPWILYFILIGNTQEQLDIAVIVAALSAFVFEFKGIKKGFILSWGTLAFFVFMLVAVVLFKNQWVAKHEWLFSNGALTLIAWFSILIRKPFTIQYAKEQVSEDKWKHPLFLKINYIVTAAWGLSFLLSLGVQIALNYFPSFANWIYQLLSYALIVFAVCFTIWFPNWYREKQRSKLAQIQKENPYLEQNFAPVKDELDVQNLKIIGEIPSDLLGVYMRNGPNPAFPPISYTYPFDGDGMIHAIYIADGKAQYRNQFVETHGLMKERKAGKALYGGLLKPIPMDPHYADAEDEPIAIKNGAFIHIIRHAGQYLAMSEGAPAYEINAQLKTIGEWKARGATKPLDVCPHTRLDPITGDLWFVNYSVFPPYLTIYCLDSKGTLLRKWDIEKSHCTMIHDFVLTENYVIIFDCPAVLDIKKMMTGGSVLNWQPELGVRIGVMSRSGGKMQWFDTDPFFVFHFANAYETGDEIIVDFVRHTQLNILSGNGPNKKTPPMLHRTILHRKTGSIKHVPLDDRGVEFPRIREDRDTLAHQFIYTPTRTAALQNNRAMNALLKYDVKNQRTEIHDFGSHAEIGEAVFAPARAAKSEDDGYVMLFVYESTNEQSEFVILDAKNFTDEPLARIQMPRRIPHGLHGSWMPGEW